MRTPARYRSARVAAACGAAAALPLGVLLLARAPAQAGARAASIHVVTLKDISFHPARLTITHGDSVRFLWRDPSVTHNVTSKGHSRFASAGNRQRGSYTVRFARRGTYHYVCTIHFGMKGTIIVR